MRGGRRHGLSARPPRFHRQDRLGPVQDLELRLLAHPQDNRTVRRGHVEPHDVLHLVDYSGPVNSLNVSPRCSFRQNADQIRCTVVCDTQVVSAMLRTDQCVASFRIVLSIRSLTSATLSSVTVPAQAIGRIPDTTRKRHHFFQWSQSNRIRQVPKLLLSSSRRLAPPADIRREKATGKEGGKRRVNFGFQWGVNSQRLLAPVPLATVFAPGW